MYESERLLEREIGRWDILVWEKSGDEDLGGETIYSDLEGGGLIRLIYIQVHRILIMYFKIVLFIILKNIIYIYWIVQLLI